MAGAVVITIVLVVVLPVLVLMAGAVGSALLGFFVQHDVETTHAGSELLDTNL